MNIIIPMAGRGSRFRDSDLPKPLIEFNGKPMIQHTVKHLGLLEHRHVFVCLEEHVQEYDLPTVFSKFLRNFEIVGLPEVTNGAATTVMAASSKVSADDEILVVNSDQLLFWNKDVILNNYGTIFCFEGSGNKWSYAKVDADGRVLQVAEKVQISSHATAGMYHWKKFSYYAEAYKKMVEANDRTNGEFYVAPVYNYALQHGIYIKHVDDVIQVGTPEELTEHLEKQHELD